MFKLQELHAKVLLFVFHTACVSSNSILCEIPEFSELEGGLLSLSEVWNVSESDSRGISFYLSHQGRWSANMIDNWENTAFKFLELLKSTIWLPAHTKHFQFWRVPLLMPNYHTMGVHVHQFVNRTGCWAAFGEESFERYHQTGKCIGKLHCHNLSPGSKICSNLQNAWIKILPRVSALQASGEMGTESEHLNFDLS